MDTNNDNKSSAAAAQSAAVSPADGGPRPWTFPARVLCVVGIVVVLLMLWHLRAVFILVFGALVFATIFLTGARFLVDHTGLGLRAAVALTVLSFIVVLGGTGWLIGEQFSQQLQEIGHRIPQAIDAMRGWVENRLGTSVSELMLDLGGGEAGGAQWSKLAQAAGLTVSALGTAVLMLILAIYIAADPDLYRRGFLKLFPTHRRAEFAGALDASAHGLSRWLLGQAISMLFLGAATAIGLALLGVPLALALGIITGLFAFIPFFGSVAAGVLAVLVAFTEGPQLALYTGLLFFVIQQVEEYLLVPLVQRWAVRLPPVLGLIAVVIFGALFSVLGVIFATPLMVVVMILTQKLYVKDVLEQHGKPSPT